MRELLHGLDNARMLEPAQSVSWGGYSITLTALFGLSTLVEWSRDWDYFINLRYPISLWPSLLSLLLLLLLPPCWRLFLLSESNGRGRVVTSWMLVGAMCKQGRTFVVGAGVAPRASAEELAVTSSSLCGRESRHGAAVAWAFGISLKASGKSNDWERRPVSPRPDLLPLASRILRCFCLHMYRQAVKICRERV